VEHVRNKRALSHRRAKRGRYFRLNGVLAITSASLSMGRAKRFPSRTRTPRPGGDFGLVRSTSLSAAATISGVGGRRPHSITAFRHGERGERGERGEDERAAFTRAHGSRERPARAPLYIYLDVWVGAQRCHLHEWEGHADESDYDCRSCSPPMTPGLTMPPP